jgi:hypothetical protein
MAWQLLPTRHRRLGEEVREMEAMATHEARGVHADCLPH